MSVKIADVEKKSIAYMHGIRPHDVLVSINQNEIIDILDYRFYEVNSKLSLKLLNNKNKEYTVNIKKSIYDSLGLVFNSYLMDKEHSCRNKCIFCFIDQLPPGMRDTLYFKDDDSRLSFLTGNYITLTNFTEHEINRIIKMHISPINISVHTTNKALRNKMMNNRFAGESLDIMQKFYKADIKMNCQIVLCPGINDDVELLSTLNDLKKLYPAVSSIAIVPVGLTRFRENLFPLTLFNYEKACKTISTIEEFGNCCKEEFGTRLAYPADEFYIIARKSIPNIDFYEELNQLENGVGLISLLNDEFLWAINDVTPVKPKHKKISVATGIAAFDFIDNLLSLARKKYNIDITVFPIKNIFFGENITVSGLITGNDIIKQLKNKDLGEKLLLPRNMLRSQKDVFLDDTTVEDIKKKLNLPVEIVENSGEAFLYSILGMEV